jgi:hypothetical protein
MRTARLVALGLVAGFAAGIGLSEVIGIVGVLAFDTDAGIRYLPFYLALAFAVAFLVLGNRSRR